MNYRHFKTDPSSQIKQQPPRCCFVMLGYNNVDLTRHALQLLWQNTDRGQVSILLVDNNSPQPLSELAEELPIDFLRTQKNTGYVGGNNRAAELILQHGATFFQGQFKSEKARPDFICFINNDVLIDEKFGEQLPLFLKQWSENSQLAAAQPALYLDAEYSQLENAGIHYFRTGLARQNRDFSSLREQTLTQLPCNDHNFNHKQLLLLNGACLFLKTTIIEKLVQEKGYVFHPLFFMYGEDVELSLRLLKHDFSFVVETKLKAQHLESGGGSVKSTQSIFYYWRNLLLTLLTTRSTPWILRHMCYLVWGQLVMLGYSFRHGKPFLFLRVYVSGFRSLVSSKFFCHFPTSTHEKIDDK